MPKEKKKEEKKLIHSQIILQGLLGFLYFRFNIYIQFYFELITGDIWHVVVISQGLNVFYLSLICLFEMLF